MPDLFREDALCKSILKVYDYYLRLVSLNDGRLDPVPEEFKIYMGLVREYGIHSSKHTCKVVRRSRRPAVTQILSAIDLRPPLSKQGLNCHARSRKHGKEEGVDSRRMG